MQILFGPIDFISDAFELELGTCLHSRFNRYLKILILPRYFSVGVKRFPFDAQLLLGAPKQPGIAVSIRGAFKRILDVIERAAWAAWAA